MTDKPHPRICPRCGGVLSKRLWNIFSPYYCRRCLWPRD